MSEDRGDPGYVAPCPDCTGTGRKQGLAGEYACMTCDGNRFVRYWTTYGADKP